MILQNPSKILKVHVKIKRQKRNYKDSSCFFITLDALLHEIVHSWEFVCVFFLFHVRRHCDKSINILQLLPCSKFKVSKKLPLWILKLSKLYTSFFLISLVMKTLCRCKKKINEAVGKRIWKASEIRYVVRN